MKIVTVLKAKVFDTVLGEAVLSSKIVPGPQPKLKLNYWMELNQCTFM